MASIPKEFRYAATFLANLAGSKGRLTVNKILSFQVALEKAFAEKYQPCWFPSQPLRGSGNRCIRIHSFKVDPLVARVATECGLHDIKSFLPSELILWVDPKCVCYKLSDCSPTFMVYDEGSQLQGSNVVPAHTFEPSSHATTTQTVMSSSMSSIFERPEVSIRRSAVVFVNA